MKKTFQEVVDEHGIDHAKKILIDYWYRPVYRYEDDYYVHEDSSIFSLKRGIVVSPIIINHRVKIRLWKNGHERKHFVSRIVCTAFHRKPKRGEQCNHDDLDVMNNHASNLYWTSPAENAQHRVRNWGGITRKGIVHSNRLKDYRAETGINSPFKQ